MKFAPLFALLGVATFALLPHSAPTAPSPAPAQEQPPTQQPPPPPVATLPIVPPAARVPSVTVVVIDPAHGGTDAGARGAANILEKDVVLHYAVLLRDQLQRHGLRAILTRHGAEGPSFDQRAAIANSYRSALYISLHAASTGPVGAARCYFDPAADPASPATPAGPSPTSDGPIPWARAQQPYAEHSRRLATLIQLQLIQRFAGSPAEPAAIPVRPLRNIAAPAVAVEVSSVSAANREQLDRMAVPLAEALALAINAFRGGG